MTLTELRYIIAVAREQHFGRAAERCHVSQPTLSVAIKKLEDELGVTIFERGSNEVTLSPVGKLIVQQAQQTLESADGIKQVALRGKDQLSGALRIGAIHTIGPYLYPELIPVLHKVAPGMPLVVEENMTAVLTEKLKHGELDVIIIALPFKERGIVTQPLYEEPFVALFPAAHPLTSRKTINSELLEDENVLLLGQGHCFRDHVLEACPACIPKPGLEGDLPHTVEGSSLETIRHMVVSGLGVTVLPCTAAGAHSYSQRLLAIRRFRNPVPSRTVALAWRVSFPRPKVIDVINKAVRECNLSCVKLARKT
ncbi:MAG: hydrogen peroxide-inducible genes activator [Gammaproteobacteria bacterium]|jgi:LysR family hydrogen peroxide-inducible transcriptional activator|nr:hydrogen peroxide-inducible genes activator [Gammaproteobacteria bacterium]